MINIFIKIDIAINMNVKYNHYIINSKPPTYDTHDYTSRYYPFSSYLEEYIDKDCIKYTKQFGSFCLLDEDDIVNKFIVSVHYLLIDDVKLLIDSDFISYELLNNCMIMLSKFYIYYPYCVNEKKYLEIVKIILDKIVKISDIINDDILDKYLKNISIMKDYYFSGVRFNLLYDPNKFDGFDCVNNSNELINLILSYDDSDDVSNNCKYCFSSLQKDKFINPCLCKSSMHIDCFKKYCFDKKNCEICQDSFKLNEKRKKSVELGTMIKDEDIIFFPYDNFYPVPLFEKYDIKKYYDNDIFTMALCYLQTQRLKDLLEEAKINKYAVNFGRILKYFLEGSLPSNYSKKYNEKDYMEIKNILLEYNII